MKKTIEKLIQAASALPSTTRAVLLGAVIVGAIYFGADWGSTFGDAPYYLTR
jgi:hypothetical protein